MAKDLFNAKVEPETKDKMKQLTEKYKKEGYIHFDGDILNIAVELLERNLSVQSPRTIVGIEELDQLTARINRLFVNTIEQNNSYIQTLTQEHEDQFKKAKLTIEVLIEEKQQLKNHLVEQGEKMNELYLNLEERKSKAEELNKENNEKSKYILLLETSNKEFEIRIQEIIKLEEQNTELVNQYKQKEQEIQVLERSMAEQVVALEGQKQEHKGRIQEQEIINKKALLTLEKDLIYKFNKQLDEIRAQRDEYIDIYNNKLSLLQEKYESLFADKQVFQINNETLKNQLLILQEKYEALFADKQSLQNNNETLKNQLLIYQKDNAS